MCEIDALSVHGYFTKLCRTYLMVRVAVSFRLYCRTASFSVELNISQGEQIAQVSNLLR